MSDIKLHQKINSIASTLHPASNSAQVMNASVQLNSLSLEVKKAEEELAELKEKILNAG